MRWRSTTVSAVDSATRALAVAGASASAMHPRLGARLSSAIHTGQSGAVLLELGMHDTRTGCASESIEHPEDKPGGYSVWADTSADPGEVRGSLFAGTART